MEMEEKGAPRGGPPPSEAAIPASTINDNNDGSGSGNGGEDDLPRIIGNYEVIRAIGKGKFAVVYRAKRLSDGEIVALKRIKVDAIDKIAREKCLKEIRLLQSLDHPNIIHYLDSFLSDNDLVIIIEWAAAGDLKRQLRKAQERGVGFEERIIWKYFSQICDAMQHMHERRIMHRDLKPANIFLTLDGTIKVGDLGLSRELSEHTFQAHSKVGTPLYMSPEVLRGDGYDFKSDVWSLGCLLYELAMLKSPFRSEGLNLYSLFQKISSGDYQPLPNNYSEQLRTLAYSMISTNSEERPELSNICTIAAAMRAQTAKKIVTTSGADIQNQNVSEPTADKQISLTPTLPITSVTPEPVEIRRNGQQGDGNSDRNGKNSRIAGSEGKGVQEETVAEAKALDGNQRRQPLSKEVAAPDRTMESSGRPAGKGDDSTAQSRNSRTDQKQAANGVHLRDDEVEPARFTKTTNTTKTGTKESTNTRPSAEFGSGHEVVNAERSPKAGASNWSDMLEGDFGAVQASNTASNSSGKGKPAPYTRLRKEEKKEEKLPKPTAGKTKNLSEPSVAQQGLPDKNRRDDSNGSSANDKSDDDTVAAGVQNNTTRSNLKATVAIDQLEKASEALALMEMVHTKLCLLDYESYSSSGTSRKSKLLPLHFAVDLNQMGRIAGTSSSGLINWHAICKDMK
jgi:serine/threonine protein kinase